MISLRYRRCAFLYEWSSGADGRTCRNSSGEPVHLMILSGRKYHGQRPGQRNRGEQHVHQRTPLRSNSWSHCLRRMGTSRNVSRCTKTSSASLLNRRLRSVERQSGWYVFLRTWRSDHMDQSTPRYLADRGTHCCGRVSSICRGSPSYTMGVYHRRPRPHRQDQSADCNPNIQRVQPIPRRTR